MIIKILSVILVLISAFIAVYLIRQSPDALVPVTNITTAAETANNPALEDLATAAETALPGKEIVVVDASSVDNSQSTIDIQLWAKLGFSVMFGLSALYIVLSQKYSDDATRWAFSVLTLISGVWIGTIS